MEHNVLSNIPGIQYYPIVSLLLFFACFAGMIVWYFVADRNRLETISRSPLDEGEAISEFGSTTNGK